MNQSLSQTTHHKRQTEGNKHLKRSSIHIREMQFKATIEFFHTPRMTKIQTMTSNAGKDVAQ